MRTLLSGTTLLTALLALAVPSAGSAATTMGSTSVPDAGCGTALATVIQIEPANGAYTAPTAGVITSWTTQTAANPPATMRLRVVRRNPDPIAFTTVGRSAAESIVANDIRTFTTRIPVAAGDILGISVTGIDSTYGCGTVVAPGSAIGFRADDPAPGSTDNYTTSLVSINLPISAQLEPDADGDGFGDETQDLCPADAADQGPCVDRAAPDTTITKSPGAKTKKKRATFTFTATEAGATFECAFDGTGFTACTAPVLKNVGRGRHVFQVRAIDAAGNVDATPARAEWKVVKKKKKRKGKGGKAS